LSLGLRTGLAFRRRALTGSSAARISIIRLIARVTAASNFLTYTENPSAFVVRNRLFWWVSECIKTIYVNQIFPVLVCWRSVHNEVHHETRRDLFARQYGEAGHRQPAP
jgi:hypothetical protein